MDLVNHLERQSAWSVKIFGEGSRRSGIINHIYEELKEVEESNGALDEWVDVVILALDGCWRSGATPQEIVTAIEAKQTKNEHRDWPDYRKFSDGDAINHVR